MPNNTKVPAAIPDVSSFETYRTFAMAQRYLTLEEEQDLCRRAAAGDEEAAREIVISHLRYVVSIAADFKGYDTFSQEDLVQEGNIGLMTAVKAFDPAKGVRFATFSLYHIRYAIQEFIIQNWAVVKIATTKPQRKLFYNLRKLKADLRRDEEAINTINNPLFASLTTAEATKIAQKLSVPVRDVFEMEQRLFSGSIQSIDEVEEADAESTEIRSPIKIEVLRLIGCPSVEDQLIQRENNNRIEKIADVLDSLDARAKDIIEARWMSVIEDGDKMTLEELGDKYGISYERVRQIEKATLKKIRELVEA